MCVCAVRIAAMRFYRNIVECKVDLIQTNRVDVYSFNRNIVECKVPMMLLELLVDAVLIETLWNVKLVSSLYLSRKQSGFNRNIVECKAG